MRASNNMYQLEEKQKDRHVFSNLFRLMTASSCLKKFNHIDANNNGSPAAPTSSPANRRHQLPEPVKSLLNELYLRGPSTVGIFRKSPNAKHCKELRHKLDTDSQGSLEHFQVSVIASVFKEWLRSLPDCLLMSRLYPQWIDVAKLIEPLHQHQQQRHQTQSLDDSYTDNTMSGNTSLRPLRSPLTDNGQHPLDRARSCSTVMISEFSINNKMNGIPAFDSDSPSASPTTMSAFALSERHSECLRIIRQLLDTLNEPNLILLRSFICVLWHIANNSEYNKMSANNLGVCVGQSLLNDERQSSGKSTASTFSKRHRRTRSQCLLSSTLSLTTLLQNGCYLDSSGAQESAKYVPMLVAFIISNAPALFGPDMTSMFAAKKDTTEIKSNANMVSMDLASSSEEHEKENQSSSSFDQVDCKDVTTSVDNNEFDDDNNNNSTPTNKVSTPIRHQVVVGSRYLSNEENSDCNISNITTNRVEDDGSATTSILIVNPQKRRESNNHSEAQHRPLSATESTSSSRASSSTSGVHSESPAFSSEVDSHNARTTTSSSSPSPSSISSPSSVSSASSPVQEPQEAQICPTDPTGHHSLSSPSSSASPISRRLSSEANALPSLVSLDSRYQDHRLMTNNRYSTFVSVLNRVPKIPVQFATSSYGGEAIIYNPRPRQPNSIGVIYPTMEPANQRPVVNSLPNDSVISVKPLTAMQAHQRQQQHPQKQQHQAIDARNRQDQLREQRLNEFLAHQHHHQQQHHILVPTPSLPYLPQSNYIHTRHNYIGSHQQGANFVAQITDNDTSCAQQHPIFYSTTNLSSLQLQQQQDRYMLYQRAMLKPQRSHVMSLRDYYLSLQQQNQQQQQHQNLQRNRLHHNQQPYSVSIAKRLATRAATIGELHKLGGGGAGRGQVSDI